MRQDREMEKKQKTEAQKSEKDRRAEKRRRSSRRAHRRVPVAPDTVERRQDERRGEGRQA